MAKEVKRTYAEWVEKGYHVLPGEKSVERDDNGTCLFFQDQVAKTLKPYKGTYKVVLSRGTLGHQFAHIQKTTEKTRNGSRLLCRCKTKEDAELVAKGIKYFEAALNW